MDNSKIIIKGARENNLKNIDIEIPKNKFVVMTGLSGSGKTTLAFDTIYAEGQRRYVESLSAYARQFLGGINKPDVDVIEGLSPSIAIDQKTTSNNPRSTVGTVTEIYDYLRLLFARIGTPYCPNHKIPISATTIKEMCDRVLEYPDGERIQILAPVFRQKKGMHKDILEKILRNGFIRVRVDGEVKLVEEIDELSKNQKHDLDIIVDRLVVGEDIRSRLYDSFEIAIKWGNGIALVLVKDEEILFSVNYACPHCGFSLPKLEPRLFSFNSPLGACPDCKGIGVKKSVDLSILVPDESKSLNEAAIQYYRHFIHTENIEWQEFELLCNLYNIDMDKPFSELTDYEKDIVINGSDKVLKYTITTRSGNKMHRHDYIEGCKRRIERLYIETTSEMMRKWYNYYMHDEECPTCKGNRLDEKVLSVFVDNKNINDITGLSIKDSINYFKNLHLTPQQKEISRLIVKEIRDRLGFLANVGLGYLDLARNAGTLSGGEAQRIRLATQVGSRLSGVLYVLDEPSIGLHQKDNAKLIQSLKEMRDLGNSLIVVEHDEETMLESDYLIDIGPGSGIHGGEIVSSGTPDEVMQNENSITGRYLSGKEKIDVPTIRRKGNGKFLTIKGASENNLKNIDVTFPLGSLIVVTGVSGSGKSTLVNEILCKGLLKSLGRVRIKVGAHKKFEGLEHIDKVIEVSQEPIGRTPRSNPATYTGVFDHIRDLFASTIESKARGYSKGRFSFNVKGGRCEKCQGDGVVRVPMHFLPDVFVPCEQCGGKRYNDETLQVTFKGKNIHDILDMTVEDALHFFENNYKIVRGIQALNDVGLGYIKLGQSALTLSGGEAQRIKLATELQRRSTGSTLYILDEPTTGLHSADVKRLIKVLNTIVDQGDTMVIIEHNLDVIKCADYIIDLGPEGGDEGGTVIATGTPEEIAKVENSYTGQFLKHKL